MSKRTFPILIAILMVFAMMPMIGEKAHADSDISDVYQKIGAFVATGYGDVGSEALLDRTQLCTQIGSHYFWAWDSYSYDDPYWTISISDTIDGEDPRDIRVYGYPMDGPSVISNGQTIYYANEGCIYRTDIDAADEEEVLWTGDYSTRLAGCFNGRLYYVISDEDSYYTYSLYSYDLDTGAEKYIGPYDVGDCYGQYLVCSDGDYQRVTGDHLYVYDAATDDCYDLPVGSGVATIGEYGIRFFDGEDIKSCDIQGRNIKLIKNVYDTNLYDRQYYEDSPGMFFWMSDIGAAYGFWNEAERDDEWGSAFIPMHRVSFHNVLAFSTDVWGFPNPSDEKCGVDKQLMKQLGASSREIMKRELNEGSYGHCFGMSASVILHKLGLEDMTLGNVNMPIRGAANKGAVRDRICFYHKTQHLMDERVADQEFLRLNEKQRLAILEERVSNVKNGGNPVLLSYSWPTRDENGNIILTISEDGRTSIEKWSCHSVVAYDVQSGSFKSPASGKTYDRRILVYDSNVLYSFDDAWHESACLLFDHGTDQWEVPFQDYILNGYGPGSANSGSYIMEATVDSRHFDAHDDFDTMGGYVPEACIRAGQRIVMSDLSTGQQWTIDACNGEATGPEELLTYWDPVEEGTPGNLRVLLPNEEHSYRFEPEEDQADRTAIDIVYAGELISFASETPASGTIDPNGTVSVNNEEGEFSLTVARDDLEGKGLYDTYSVEGSGQGTTTMSTSGEGVEISGDDITGATVKASNYNEVASSEITRSGSVKYGRDQSGYDRIEYIYEKPINKATVSGLKNRTYTGKPIHQNLKITLDGKTLKEKTDYKVAYKNCVSAGTAKVTITGIGDYTGTITKSFKINKAANPLKIKAKTATVKYSKLKKKAQTLGTSKLIKFTQKGQGKITYTISSVKKGSKSFKSKITLNKKNGKATVKKGLKKGTYKVKVKVKAAGNSNYKASAWKKVTFKVKVK